MSHKENLDQIRQWTVKELSGKITETKKELFGLNQEKILGKLKNVAAIKQKKKLVARYATVLDQKISAELDKK